MTIRIAVDSTADLPVQTAAKLGIEIIPMLIHFGAQSYKDELEISRREFYERLQQPGAVATTAAPGPGVFTEVYDRLAEQGAQDVLSLHLASSLSATYSIADSVRSGYTRVRVSAVDAGQLSLGLGFLAETAAREVQQGARLDRVIEVVKEQMERTFVFAALDSMEYLARSGRVHSLVAGLGGVLRIKPILKLHRNLATTERVRTGSRAMQRLIEILRELAPIQRAAIVHANAPERAEEIEAMASELLPAEGLIVADITPAIGVHVGPGTVGFAVVAREAKRAAAARTLFE